MSSWILPLPYPFGIATLEPGNYLSMLICGRVEEAGGFGISPRVFFSGEIPPDCFGSKEDLPSPSKWHSRQQDQPSWRERRSEHQKLKPKRGSRFIFWHQQIFLFLPLGCCCCFCWPPATLKCELESSRSSGPWNT